MQDEVKEVNRKRIVKGTREVEETREVKENKIAEVKRMNGGKRHPTSKKLGWESV